MNLAPAVDFRAWEATAIVRIGAFDYHLLVPTNRKRHLPIVIKVSSELLRELLVLREDAVPVDLAYLKECNDRQADAIREYERTIQTLRMDLTAREDQLQDAEQRLCELRDSYAERGEQLAVTRALAQTERASADFHKQCREQMAAAIRKVLNPSIPPTAWKKVHDAFRNVLWSRLYHARCTHPWWSRHRWFGCLDCVPDWMLLEVTDLTDAQAMVPCAVAEILNHETAAILRPTLIGGKEK